MSRWKIEQKWQGGEVFIIGGGDSLRNFDWTLLEDELTIGCNAAFFLGEKVCKICFIGDFKFVKQYKEQLAKFKNDIFTNSPQLLNTDIPWLFTMGRRVSGLHKDALGWGGNTGASAVNLALILGASIVYLLGFDMKTSKGGEANWHLYNKILDKVNPRIYPSFIKGFGKVVTDLDRVFPGRKIVNITDDSGLNMFPKIGVGDFWKNRLQVKEVIELERTMVVV